MRLTLRITLALLIELFATLAIARPAVSYLPAGTPYDPAVPTPASYLGFAVGERHVRPDRLVGYLRVLAERSDRVLFAEQGRTHEGRPQVLLTISSPENLRRLEEIRRDHIALSEPGASAGAGTAADAPVVVWLGYSIHGNEASGANASLLVAYHLAAARSPEVEDLLRHSIVLLDPSLNPDGLGRFTTWANMYRGDRPVADAFHREHREAWPGGRTNHYWFDLNRDWLLVQQPESRHRVATFQAWRPNVFADFHEMGSDSTYFFQPGVPSRQNPLTPPENLALTRTLARYHAAALDRAGKLYFTEETFDDFYYGKGSTYPDIQGGVGILFEQASARGHLRETPDGPLAFADAVGDQVLTSLSTLTGALENRRDLLAYQHRFYADALADAERGDLRAYVVGTDGDAGRGYELLRVLAAHGIEVRRLARPLTVDGRSFSPGEAWVIPLAQRQSRLVRALFDRRTQFADNTFYDVSSWTLPLAFGLPYAEIERGGWKPELLGEAVREPALAAGHPPSTAVPYAYAFSWKSSRAPRALARLLAAGVRTRVATAPFRAATGAGELSMTRGTIVVPLGIQSVSSDEIRRLLAAASEDAIDVWALSSGLTPAGVDLGSPRLRPLSPVRPLLLIGEGVSSSEAGEVWHLLDHRLGMALSLVDLADLPRIDLARYSHVLMVDGRYERISKDTIAALGRWLAGGGTLIATKGAAVWAGEAFLQHPPKAPPPAGPAPPTVEVSPHTGVPRRAYGDYEHDRATAEIAGSIFEVELDLTHPLAFGLARPTVPVFRDSTAVLAPSDDPYENAALYTEAPLLAGYASAERVAQVAGSAAAIATRVGRGTLIRFADDPNFRAFWQGSSRLYQNALFFGPVMKRTSAPASWQ